MRLQIVSKKTNLVLVPILVVLFLSSCISQKRTKYLQDKLTVESNHNLNFTSYIPKVQPLDELYIKVTSTDKELGSTDPTTTMSLPSTATLFLLSYKVGKDGCINYPVLGKVQVKDLTIDEVEHKLEDQLQSYLSNPTVTAKFVNNFITIIGEVKRPGRYDYTKDKLSIFEALGLGGDITDFGNGQRINVIRSKDSTNTITYLDITNKQIVNSEFYFLRPNDIVYVEPVKAKIWNYSQLPLSITLSLISSTLLLLNYLKK